MTLSPTDPQRQIYNYWLRAIAEKSGRPYRNRKNFDNFSDIQVIELGKLEMFFERNKIEDIQNYFTSVLGYFQEKSLPLDFFTTSKASTAFAKTLKFKQFRERTDTEFITESLDSLVFIFGFCAEHNIKPDEYINFSREQGSLPVWLEHIQKGKIFPGVMMCWDNFRIKYDAYPEDLMEFVLGGDRKIFLENLMLRCYHYPQIGNKLQDTYKKLKKLL